MLLLEWIIIISISLAILSVMMVLFFIITYGRTTRRLQNLSEKKPKKRGRRRKWRRDKHKLKLKQSVSRRNSLLFFGLFCLSAAVGGYGKYYQMTTMTENDTENIVTGYYLRTQVEEQLNSINKEEANLTKVGANVHTLAVRMASFSAKQGDPKASTEGQLLLNKYYARMGQLGVNLAAQDFNVLASNSELLKSYLDDIAKVGKSETSLLNFYEIDESSLRQKK